MNLQDFFLSSPIPSTAINGVYDLRIVVLSMIVQIFASYVMIDMGLRLRYSNDSYAYKLLWLFGGAFAIGAGTGAMHFIGGLGYDLPMPSGMIVRYIVYSFLVGIVGAIFALVVIENKKIPTYGLVIAGIIFGLSIVFMHYVSMAAMEEDMIIYNKPEYFVASVIAGLFAGEATIWLTLACNVNNAVGQIGMKFFSALIIAAANIAQHYLAMAGAVFIPRDTMGKTLQGVLITDPNIIAAICAIITLLIMGIALILSTYKQLITSALQRKNQALEEALDNLKKAQGQLIQSEKMASLGQLISGISHEINTPAGAILAAVQLVKDDYILLLQQLIHLMQSLPKELSERYLSICDSISKLNKSLPSSTVGIRQSSREIEAILAANNITNSRQISKNLAAIGVTQNTANDIIPLLNIPQKDLVHNSLFKYGMSQIHIRDINLAIERIVDLVKALKLYSQGSQGQLKLVDLREQLDNALIILHNKLKRDIIIEKDFAKIPKLKCYAEPLNQVWLNLINNAMESIHGSGGKIILRIKENPEKKQMIVEVEDNGPGIPVEVFDRIFDPYFTTKEAGTGLGLSIVKDIIDKNQGEILVDTHPGKTIFKIILPTNITEEIS